MPEVDLGRLTGLEDSSRECAHEAGLRTGAPEPRCGGEDGNHSTREGDRGILGPVSLVE